MNQIVTPYIVIIDDDVTADLPLVDYLHREYGKDNVHLFQEPTEGIQFIENNLSRRIIVLLDIMFQGKQLGFKVFHDILKKSALVCFIIMTGSVERASREQLLSLINGHAWYLIQRDRPAKEILDVVNAAASHLRLRVDGGLEEWIARHSAEERESIHENARRQIIFS